jgi:hypothetical protein
VACEEAESLRGGRRAAAERQRFSAFSHVDFALGSNCSGIMQAVNSDAAGRIRGSLSRKKVDHP